MKKTTLLILVLILVSCSTLAIPVSIPAEKVIPTETLAQVSILEPTKAPMRTVVPLTSTVDLAHLPSATPQPAAHCPSVDEKVRIPLSPVFKNKKAPYHDAREAVLKFLNQGGNPKVAAEKLAEHGVQASMLDLTHDGVPEFILPSGYWTVFGCQNGKYLNLLDIPPAEAAMTAVPLVIQDLNQNGLLELLIGQVQLFDLARYHIFEWDGKKFANIAPESFMNQDSNVYIKNQVIYAVGQSNAKKGALEGNWEVTDTDGNGLKDIIVRAGVFDNFIASSTLEDSMILK